MSNFTVIYVKECSKCGMEFMVNHHSPNCPHHGLDTIEGRQEVINNALGQLASKEMTLEEAVENRDKAWVVFRQIMEEYKQEFYQRAKIHCAELLGSSPDNYVVK